MALSLFELALAGGAIYPLIRCHHAAYLKFLGRFAEAEKAYWDILWEHPEAVEATQGLRVIGTLRHREAVRLPQGLN